MLWADPDVDLVFNFDVHPDPTFHFDADPDSPGRQGERPCGSGPATAPLILHKVNGSLQNI